MQETQVQPPGREDSLVKGMAAHSSILVWTEERDELHAVRGVRESDTTVSNTFTEKMTELDSVSLSVRTHISICCAVSYLEIMDKGIKH